jgi:hypothetical protein
MCVVVGLQEPLRFVPVVGFEAGLFAGDFVFQVVDAPRALD